MARPTKIRKVLTFPKETYFIPEGVEKNKLDEVLLKVEEVEAIRLKDREGLSQEEAAEKIGITRQTFQNIIDSARRKVAIALSEGKAIRIMDGEYTTANCKLFCNDCKIFYDINYKRDYDRCPTCGSDSIQCSEEHYYCERWCVRKNSRK